MYGKRKKRISKKRDPWYNKWLHYGKRTVAAGSGAALGYIYGNLPGAVSGAKYGWGVVGNYKRPLRAVLASNRKPRLSSNPSRNPYPGTRRYHRPVRDPDPFPFPKGTVGTNPPNKTHQGAFMFKRGRGWVYKGGIFSIGSKRRRGHRGKVLMSRKY